MKGIVVAFLGLFCALAVGKNIETIKRIPQKIVGGTETSIDKYPYGVAMLTNRGSSSIYSQSCGGTILTSTAILSAASCYKSLNGADHDPNWWKIRVGSTQSNSGGQVHDISQITNHDQFSWYTLDYDVAFLRTATTITYGASVAPASIAGSTYPVPDNSPVWAIGWGSTIPYGPAVTNLRHVQLWTVNQDTCISRHGSSITDRMLCSGWLDVGGVDQCQGDSGGPLIHNGVIVGICSWGIDCAQPYWPGVNTRVSAVSNWIVQQAQS